MTLFLSSRFIVPAIGLALACSGAARATDEAPASQAVAFKFTTGIYQLSGGGLPSGTSLDLNLRATGNFGNAWLGQYRSPGLSITQTRIGWDRSFKLGALRFVPSLEVATGGYVGGSAYVETGESWYGGAGIGRTNLQNFVNLNFDPGDAWTLAGGYRWADNHSLGLQIVRDNRLNPDQQNVHLTYRTPIAGDDRLTLDLLTKRGLVAGVLNQRTGFSVVYDWPRFFVRLAVDPLVNFTTQDMVRLSVGTRF